MDDKIFIEAELAKGDHDKFMDLITDLNELQSKYSFESEEYKAKYKKCNATLNEIVQFLIK